MRLADYWQYSLPVFVRHKSRTALLTLAVAIGVCSVVLLTSIGEGARHFIEREFASLGTQLLIILPGKKETQGGAPPLYGTTPRDLTLDDMRAIAHLPTIDKMAPVIAGTTLISFGNRSREAIVMGSTPEFFAIRNLLIGQGQILPASASDYHVPVIVLGSKLKQELFGQQEALNQWLKVGDYRFRVLGVLQERGESLGLDLRDMAVIPVRSAEMVFDSPALFRILVQLKQAQLERYTEQRIRKIIAERHEGEDDISFVSQDSLLSAFYSILNTVTAVVGAIAGISLIVAGVLIMNVTYISVAQRRQEIGLLKAIGATRKQVQRIFIGEALLLTSAGVIGGLLVALLALQLARWFWPEFPLTPSGWALALATSAALVLGWLFSWLPANKAASLDPILALKGLH